MRKTKLINWWFLTVQVDELLGVLSWFVLFLPIAILLGFGITVEHLGLLAFYIPVSLWIGLMALLYFIRERPFWKLWWAWLPGLVWIGLAWLVDTVGGHIISNKYACQHKRRKNAN